jgi:pilus assembly protein Flp/PilA
VIPAKIPAPLVAAVTLVSGTSFPILGVLSMTKFTRTMVEFLKKEDGPTAVEYAVMLALIIVVCIVAITALGNNASATFSYVSSNVKTPAAS